MLTGTRRSARGGRIQQASDSDMDTSAGTTELARPVPADTWFGQPKGLTILFLTEMWEKFSFFGMRTLQVYYMIKQLHFSQADASLVYGLYAGGVYLTPIFGGYIADRWLGRRRAVIAGGLLMALGHFMLTQEALFFPALAVIAVGNGLFLPNLPSQIDDLYGADDPRRGGAYNVYYVGVNLGALLAPLVCGTLGEVYGWHYGFGAAGIGMCLGLAVYVLGRRHLPSGDARRRAVAATRPAAAGAPAAGRLLALLLVGLAVIVFRIAYEQSGNTLAVWADTAVDRTVLGFLVPVTWVQALNPLLVFLLTPLVVSGWRRAAAAGREPVPIRKMALGALGMGLSYLLLALAGQWAAVGGALAHWGWLLAFFGVYTLAELYILPVGIGMFVRLAPPGREATAIAGFFLASFAGNLLSGYVGGWWAVMSPAAFFALMAAVALVSALMLFATAPLLRRVDP
jgi:POT family proton-dependent oligopeptide transporter